MPLRLLILFTIHCSLFSPSLAQTFPEWSVFDSRKKEIAKVLADSVSGYSAQAILLHRGSKQYFYTLQNRQLGPALDSVTIHHQNDTPFAIAYEAREGRLLNAGLGTIAAGFKSIIWLNKRLNNAVLVQDSVGQFRWLSLGMPLKTRVSFDSVKVFSEDLVLGRGGASFYWLHEAGPVLLQVPKAISITSIKKALSLRAGRAAYLALLQGGNLRLFNMKGAAVGAPSKAADIRPALTGVIFRNKDEWYYQDPLKTLPVPLKGRVISADEQKIIVSRQGKFFAFWAGGRATWLKLETADSVGLYRAGLAGFRYKGRYGFIDSIGYIRIAARYQQASDFENGYSVVKAGGKWGVIDRRENFVIQPFNDSLWYWGGLFAQQSTRGVFLFDPATGTTGETYDSLKVTQSGFITQKSGKQGYLNTKAKTILAPRFDAVQEISPLNLVAYRQNNAWFFPEGNLGKYRSVRKLSVCPIGGYCFVQPGDLN